MKSKYTGLFSCAVLMLVAASFFTAASASEPKPARAVLQANAQTLEKINLNTADSPELQKIRGIGPKFADRILEYRKEHGRFQSPDELVNVKGIGPVKYERIKNQVTI